MQHPNAQTSQAFSLRIGLILCLNACAWAGVVLCKTYTDLLFLSTFPATDLPKLFLGQAVGVFLVIRLLSSFIAKGSRFYSGLILLVSTLGIAAYAALDSTPLLIYVFCLWLSMMSVLLAVIAMNTISDHLDARQFSQWLLSINVAANTGSLCMGLSIPFIIQQVGTEHLLTLLAGVSLLCIMLLSPLKALPSLPKKPEQRHRTWHYPLFVSLALCTFFVLVVEVLADYLLKLELSRLYQDAQAAEIGSFMGPFYGIASMFTLALQLAATRFLLGQFGVTGLLSILPAFSVFMGGFLLFLPGLWSVAGLRMGGAVLRSSFNTTGRDLSLNPLPTRIRRAAKLEMKGIGFVGTGFAAVLLWLFADQIGSTGIIYLMLIFSVLWLLLTWRINQQYRVVLDDAVKTRRLSLDDIGMSQNTLASHQEANIKSLIHKALNSKDDDNIRFAFSLLSRHPKIDCSLSIEQHVSADSIDIRLLSISQLATHYNLDYSNCLQTRLQIEKNSQVLWVICQALSQYTADFNQATRQYIPILLQHESALVQAGAVVILNHSTDTQQQMLAAQHLMILQTATAESARYAAAQAWGYLQENESIDKKALQPLIDDLEESVSMAAMQSATHQNWLEYSPALVSRLGQGSVSRYAANLLNQFGEPILPLLMRKLKHSDSSIVMQSIMRLLTRMSGKPIEARLQETLNFINQSGNLAARHYFARGCALRVHHQGASSAEFKRYISYALDNELNYAYHLRTVINAGILSAEQVAECKHRLLMAEQRLLYWLVVVNSVAKILNMSHTLLSQPTTAQSRARRAQSLEWLETLGDLKHMRNVVAYLEKKVTVKYNSDKSLTALRNNKTDVSDSWLQRILLEIPPSYLSNIYILRQLSLFENLSGETLQKIAKTCRAHHINTGKTLVRQGDKPDGLYILQNGTVNIEMDKKHIAQKTAPYFFGEIGLIDDTPRLASVKSHTKCDILFLSKAVFDDLVADYPDILRALIRTVIMYIRQRDELKKD